MKRKTSLFSLSLFLTAVLFSFMACSQDAEMTASFNDKQETLQHSNPFYVDYETALQEAIDFMSGDMDTRSVVHPFAVQEHYEYVVNGKNTTRTTDNDSVEVRFHVINFADNGGFALVSADSRTTPIYAYSDEGFLNMEDALANTGFDVFMDGAEAYYKSEVEKTGHVIKDTLKVNPDWLASMELITYQGVQYYAGKPYYVNGSKRLPLLNTTWNQDDPYNYYCPILDYTELPSSYDGRAAAGCVPVAIGQIMAYHKHIASGLFKKGYDSASKTRYTTEDSLTVNWDLVRSSNSYDYHLYSAGSYETANLLNQLGHYALATYGPRGTSVGGPMINSTIQTMGYTSDGFQSFADMQAITSIKLAKPVLAAGVRVSDYVTSGHVWVIDGFTSEMEIRKCYSTVFPYDYVRSIKTGNFIYYYHCNWGWGGLYNAYVLNTFPVTSTVNYGYDGKMICNIQPR